MDSSAAHRPAPAWISSVVFCGLLISSAAAIFLVGGAEDGASGIFLVAAGLTMLACPPQRRVAGGLWALVAAFLGCSALSLLPQSWFPLPAWRVPLQGLPLPLRDHLTPVFTETAFYLGILAVCSVLLLFCLAHPLRSKRLLFLATFALGICTAYAVMAIVAETTNWKYLFDGTESFGFFPNRNHTATFLITGCLLALGVLGVAGKDRQWLPGLLAAGGLGVCGTALTAYSASRGGVVFLILGAILWFAGLGRRHLTKPLAVSFAAISLLGIVLFSVAESEVRGRLLDQFGGRGASRSEGERLPATVAGVARDISLDARILIYKDTLRMIAAQPWSGVGLGGFRYVYHFYRKDSLWEATSEHPESDWLMVAAEQGIPAFLIFLAGVVVLLRRLRAEREQPSWPLRWGVVCAVLGAFLHGLVDVPTHRIALGFWILALAGAGLQIFRIHQKPPPFWQRLVFYVAGIGAIGMGVYLLRAQWWGGPPSPSERGPRAVDQILAVVKKDELEKAVEMSAAAIAESPMTESLYYLKGIIQLNFEGTDKEVDALFAAERALVPEWPLISIRQGKAWLGIDPARTVALWKDALSRVAKIDRERGTGRSGVLNTFGGFLQESASFPEAQRLLYASTEEDPALRLLWLRSVSAGLAAEVIPRLSVDPVFLARLTSQQRKEFFQIWYEKGNRDELMTFIAGQPEADAETWPVKIRSLVDARKYEEAVAVVAQRHRVDLDWEAVLAKRIPTRESEDPLERFVYYWKAGNEITARRVLEEASRAEGKAKASAEVWRVKAILAIREGRWEAGWSDLRRYLLESGVDELP